MDGQTETTKYVYDYIKIGKNGVPAIPPQLRSSSNTDSTFTNYWVQKDRNQKPSREIPAIKLRNFRTQNSTKYY